MSMHRSRYFLAGGVAAAAVGVCLPGTAHAAVTPSAADTTFVTANEQTNLAEIALGKLAMSHSSSPAVQALANKTMTDHQMAKSKLAAVAADLKITLPTAPNATQQAQAAQLKALSGSTFDQLYLRDQVAGHQLSIGGTTAEIRSGTSASVVNYAKGYLPVAQMHLTMAQADLKTSSGGGPGSVQAGSGGGAATNASTNLGVDWTAGALALAVLGGAVLILDRRRRTLR